jgi:Tfp pilus assembly protein PilO
MAIDMNADIGEIFKGLFSNKGEGSKKTKGNENPYSKVIGAGAGVMLIVVLYIFFIYIPTQEELEIKEEKISQIEIMRIEVDVLSNKIEKAKIELADDKKRYESLTQLFHTDKELEDLYRHISQLSLMNQLMISKLEKAGEMPVFESTQTDENQDDIQNGNYDPAAQGEQKRKKVAYYEFKVKFEISGNYANYTKFRKGMAELKKIININEEQIVVLESETAKGEVKVSATLATYRLPANDDEKYINLEDGIQ